MTTTWWTTCAFGQAARTKSPELFVSVSLLVVIVASLATGAVGLSPIVGAMIAGLLIAETDYQTEVAVMTAPFKGLALGVFLISIGMQVDLRFVAANWVALVGAVASVVLIKAAVTAGLLKLNGARILDYPHVWRWLCRVYALPGIAAAGSLVHFRQGYFGRSWNGVVPAGPFKPMAYPAAYEHPKLA